MKKLFLCSSLICFSFVNAFSQSWVGSGPNTLYPVNSSFNLTPFNLGVGTSLPTHQLHTTLGVRFEGLKQNDSLNRVIVQDADGVLYWRHYISSPIGNFWSLTGNSGTSPGFNYIGTSDNQRLVISTNATEKMTVLANGRVGVGISTPANRLHVFSNSGRDNSFSVSGDAPSIKIFSGSVEPGLTTLTGIPFGKIAVASSNNDFVTTSNPGDMVLQTIGTNRSIIFSNRFIESPTFPNGIEQMRLNGAGNLGIGMTAPTFRIHISNGTTIGWYSTTGWVHSSDKRLKTNIRSIENAMGIINELDGVYYNWKADPNSGRQVGFIAQDAKKALPEVVSGVEGDIENGEVLGMAYQNIVPVLVEALKEKDRQIAEMQSRINELSDLSNMNDDLLNRIERLETKMNAISTKYSKSLNLEQNIPNPFSNNTRISYFIPEEGKVLVELYDANGRKIMTLKNEVQAQGDHDMIIDGLGLTPGQYIYTLSLNGEQVSKKAIKL